jgi:hypothetical protein
MHISNLKSIALLRSKILANSNIVRLNQTAALANANSDQRGIYFLSKINPNETVN